MTCQLEIGSVLFYLSGGEAEDVREGEKNAQQAGKKLKSEETEKHNAQEGNAEDEKVLSTRESEEKKWQQSGKRIQ
ncbi:hypothetical protein RUM44_000281 [Polyplax serrata]|uniref:Uncharacterized protein n=1 Tax=Polyplax serrata TaxID=468196 RepID=A0ABR1B4Z5_POLSC